MRCRAVYLLLFLITCLGFATPVTAVAQTMGRDDISRMSAAEWTHRLDRVDQELRRADTTAEDADRLLQTTTEVLGEAQGAVTELSPRIESIGRRLAAMGPAPEEGAALEDADVAKRRAGLTAELRRLNGLLTQAKLAIVRVEELDDSIGSLSQSQRVEALIRVYPFPWAPDTWEEAVPEFFSVMRKIARSPVTWWQRLESEQRQGTVALRAAVLLTLSLAIGWFLRYWVLSRYGRDPGQQEPTYTARLIATIASASARGMVPALVFAVLFYLAWTSQVAQHDLFLVLVTIFFAVMVFFSLAWALPYAVLSPDLPQWRLLPVSPENARQLGWRFTLLAALFAIEIFMSAAREQIGVGDAYFSLSTLLLNAIPALILIDMGRQRYWQMELPQAADDAEEEGLEVSSGDTFWVLIRRTNAFIAGSSIFASITGYADLADFLFGNLLLSIVTIAATAILRGLGRELIGVGLRSEFMREKLALQHFARNRIKFWLRALLNLTLVGLGMMVIASIWFSPFVDFWVDARRVLSGVSIGGVTISFTDMLAALAVFVVILLLTRVGQRVLNRQILPQTGFDSGVQNSLSAGFGYIGIFLAGLFGITALGIDLSNIALIAGALSVGIGFGLQAIVSNFVSGIILLIERPIKVGDWVLVGGNEGMVKRITVRSTELQTFQRASVIIPNSEFISTAVTNWTHKDSYGRIEIPVGVAYGSDVEKVREVLLDCAQHHERVLTSPEPQVIFMNFGDSSLDFELRCFTNTVLYRLSISSDLRFAVDAAFRKAGIEIPFPQRVVHMAPPAAPQKAPETGDQDPEPETPG